MTPSAAQPESPLLRQIRALCEDGEIEQALDAVKNAVGQSPEQSSVEGLASALTPSAVTQLGLTRLKPHIVAWARFASSVPVGMNTSAGTLANIHWAAELIARVRSVFPNEPQLYVAESLLRRRDPDRQSALMVARQGAELFPEVWPCLTALMHALADIGNLDEALVFARRALALQPADGSPLNDVASAFLRAGRQVEASALFDELQQRFPGYRGH
jgi:tetratricopeptide (TPR) repeat protein